METTISLEGLLRWVCLPPILLTRDVSPPVCQTLLDTCIAASEVRVGAWVDSACTPSCIRVMAGCPQVLERPPGDPVLE